MTIQLVYDPVYEGFNVMKLTYSNIFGDYYSEAIRSFSPAQDWTSDGVEFLTFSYYADETNADQPLYVLYFLSK